MKFLLVTAVALLSAVVAAEATPKYSLPGDSPDGLYVHETDADGNPKNTHIPDFNITERSITPSAKFARDSSQGTITCKNQYTLNYNDMITAEQGLEQAFQHGGSFSGKSTSYKWSSAVAYGCNYGKGQTFSGNWLAAQFAQIAQSCGTSSPGYISFPQWKAAYGIDSSGVGFC
ncbi:hypothetical protein V8E54_000357 [Elaphomyces granulatus]